MSYVHVVFTIPHELASLALQNKKVIYDLLFRASAATLLEIAADPKHLGADIGFMTVLHTWGQNVQIHLHIHCVIPRRRTFAGSPALGPPALQVLSARESAAPRLPRKVHRRTQNENAFAKTKVDLCGRSSTVGGRGGVPRLPSTSLFRKDWVVYAKPPFLAAP